MEESSLLASYILMLLCRELILSLFFLLSCSLKSVVRASQPIAININSYYYKDSPLLLVLLIIISVALIGLTMEPMILLLGGWTEHWALPFNKHTPPMDDC